MIKTPAGEPQASGDVLGFQIRQLVEHLSRRQARGEEVEDVGDSDAQPSYAGAPTALVWIYRDSVSKGRHLVS